MSSDLQGALFEAVERLVAVVNRDPALREACHALARYVIEQTEAFASDTSRGEYYGDDISPRGSADMAADRTAARNGAAPHAASGAGNNGPASNSSGNNGSANVIANNNGERAHGGESHAALPAGPAPITPAVAGFNRPAFERDERRLPPLTFASSPREQNTSVEYEPRRKVGFIPSTSEDLQLVEQRCRMKAEGARWAARRLQLIASGVDYHAEVQPVDREIIRRAQELRDCFLWMNYPQWQPPADLTLMEDLAGAYETLAEAMALARSIYSNLPKDEAAFERVVDLLAEAQSMLRVAVSDVSEMTDSDQAQTFSWLRAISTDRHIFIQRYMRLNDPAEPRDRQDLLARIAELDGTLQEGRRGEKERGRLFGKLRYIVNHIEAKQGDQTAQWRTLAKTVADLIDVKVPASNKELRDMLLPIVDDMPEMDDCPASFDLVLQELDRYLAQQAPSFDPTDTPQQNPAVQEVAALLSGATVVLIGGDRRSAAHDALVRAFDLGGLDWIATREHQSVDRFEAAVSRPEVVVVLLAIRWASHSYGDVQKFCNATDKPLVRLPAGYNPNQVAAQILAQCGGRLKAARAGS